MEGVNVKGDGALCSTESQLSPGSMAEKKEHSGRCVVGGLPTGTSARCGFTALASVNGPLLTRPRDNASVRTQSSWIQFVLTI